MGGRAGHAGRAPGDAIRVLAVSDEIDHGLIGGIAACRSAAAILACGDLPPDYLGALMTALDVPLVFVPGNHDPDQSGYRISRNGLVTRAGFPAEPPWPAGAISADGRIVEIRGLRIAGLGGCVRYRDGPNQYTERRQASRAARLRRLALWRRMAGRGGVDIVLTHAPPRGVGDGEDPAHRGFGCYHGLVAALGAAALLHGHVHPYGVASPVRWIGRTQIRNVTGWHLLEFTRPAGLAELIPGRRDA